MLAHQDILTEAESELIIQTLKDIRHDFHEGQIEFQTALEDIHLNVEHELIKRIGPVGGKLHTGRSRNDQVATDMHLYTKKKCIRLLITFMLFNKRYCSLQNNM